MTAENLIQPFSEYLYDNFEKELQNDNLELICNEVFNNINELEPTYGNLAIWLTWYFKKVLDIDICTEYPKLTDMMKEIIRKRWRIKNDSVVYNNLEFNEESLFFAIHFKAINCVINNFSETYLDLYAVECENLTINMPKLVRFSVSSSTVISNLILDKSIKNIKMFTPSKLHGVNNIKYNGKTYSKFQFLNLVKQERSNAVNSSPYGDLYVVRMIKSDSSMYDKRFYYYIYGRKSLKSGKFRFALLSDMGNPGYSIVYFKSKEDAKNILTNFGYPYLINYLTKARVNYEDTLNGFKEVDTEYNGKVLIKEGSPGDR